MNFGKVISRLWRGSLVAKRSADNRKIEGSIPSLATRQKKFHKAFPARLIKKEDVPIMPPSYFKLSGIIWHLNCIYCKYARKKRRIVFNSCKDFRG